MNPPEKFYLTKEGRDKIEKEHKELLKLKRLRAKEEVPSALESDELNADFASFREDFEYLESRLAEIEHIIKNYELIIPPAKEERNRVHLGAQVTVEVDGQEDEFLIVGTLEANPTAGKISDRSPVGKALLGHKMGDSVFVASPTKVTYKIKRIKY